MRPQPVAFYAFGKEFEEGTYQENGHVTLPDNQPGKPANRGTVFVYGTTQPSPTDTLLAIHRVWNAAGTGGDQRGEAGDPRGAVAALEQLLADQVRVLGADHPNTLLTRNNIARWRTEAEQAGHNGE